MPDPRRWSRRQRLPVTLLKVLLAAAAIIVAAALRADALAVALVAAAVLVTLAVDALVRSRTRMSTNLERLYAALRSFTSDPDLDTTLDAITQAAGKAVDADDTAVLLREGDHLAMAVPSSHALRWTPERVAEWTRADLASGDGSPMAAALSGKQTVVVRDVTGDPRFPRWSSTFENIFAEYEYRAVVVVPLLVGGETIGLIHAAYRGRRRPDDGDVRLLEAYAEQASLVVARAQAYEKERRIAARLAETDRLQSEFLALLSHELRTPLTAAKGFVDTVLLQWDRLDDSRRRELLARASAGADELDRQITQLLDYARIEGGEVSLDLRPVRLRGAMEQVVASLEHLLEGHAVAVDVSEGLTASIDASAFEHTLANLLSNAAAFSPVGGRIEVSAFENGGGVEVVVVDDGPGVAPEHRERVFDRFYRSPVHPARRRGAGLGLAIARRYVEAWGGRIWVEDGTGGGARFAFTLPAPPRRLDHRDREAGK